jgi:hypothetical protein
MDKCPICFTTGKYHRKDCPNNTEIIIIKTEAEYNNTKTKVEELEKEIGDNWNNKEYEKQTNECKRLASSTLTYEIENNLLPI